MQTSPILNTANVNSAANANKQNASGDADVPFNQVLSREVAGRGDTAAAQKSESQNSDGAAAAKPVSANAPGGSKAADDAKADKEDDDVRKDADGAAATPDDMLALVTNLGLAGVTRLDARATETAARAAAADTPLNGVAGDGKTAARAMPLHAFDGKQAAGTTSKEIPAAEPRAGKASTNADAKHRAEPVTANGQDASPAAIAPHSAQAEKAEAVATQTAAPAAAALAKMQDTSAALPAAMQPLQHVALNAAAAANSAGAAGGPASDKLTPPVGTPAWDQALGQKVVWMVAGDQQSASLSLNPPDLGPLQVVLNVSNSHADATFVAAQPEVRQALEAAMPKLRDMLGDAGIQLGQATVSAGMSNQQNAPGEREAQAQRRAEPSDSLGDSAVRVSRVQPAAGRQGMVDTFA